MKTHVRLLLTLPLLLGLSACHLFTGHRLVSQEYGFSVEFPEKPAEQSGTNYQGLPKTLWTVEKDSSQELFSAEATTYKEPLNPSPNWIPDRLLLSSVDIQITESRRFTLRAASTGREVLAIATTARQALTGATLSSIYVVDGRVLISITARIPNARRRAAFLNSLTLLR
jgi:hypothetical protein